MAACSSARYYNCRFRRIRGGQGVIRAFVDTRVIKKGLHNECVFLGVVALCTMVWQKYVVSIIQASYNNIQRQDVIPWATWGGVGVSSDVYQQLGRASSMQPNTISFSAKMSFNVPQGEVVGFRGEVYQPFGRASSMQQNTISVKYLPSVPARSYSQPHQLSVSAGYI